MLIISQLVSQTCSTSQSESQWCTLIFNLQSVVIVLCFKNKNLTWLMSWQLKLCSQILKLRFCLRTFTKYENCYFKFWLHAASMCSGGCFHSPSRIYTSSLLGCAHYATSVEVWSYCTTTHSCATPAHQPGELCSTPPRAPISSSATTRTLKSVVGERTWCVSMQLYAN